MSSQEKKKDKGASSIDISRDDIYARCKMLSNIQKWVATKQNVYMTENVFRTPVTYLFLVIKQYHIFYSA